MIFRSAGLLLLMGTVGIAALLLNGGYVYKTSCPLASGGTQTTWTYGIDDILPYIRHTSEPCTAHTGTRLVLSAIGIAPLGNHGAEARADARSGLAKITADQKELQALDGRMEAFRREEGRPVSDAEALADDYHKLLDKARGQQPSSAKGDEAEVWRSLIGLMALHAQAADIVVRAARRGDFSHVDADIAPLNDKIPALNNSFNHALASIRGVKAPPDQVKASPAVRASVRRLSGLKDRMDAIDRRIVNTQPQSLAELRQALTTWRSTVDEYAAILTEAQSEAQRAYRLPETDDLRLAEVWRTFALMVRQRRNGTAYIVSAFKEEIETQNVPPDLQTRLETLARQQGQLNSRFEKLARRLHERLGGFY